MDFFINIFITQQITTNVLIMALTVTQIQHVLIRLAAISANAKKDLMEMELCALVWSSILDPSTLLGSEGFKKNHNLTVIVKIEDILLLFKRYEIYTTFCYSIEKIKSQVW